MPRYPSTRQRSWRSTTAATSGSPAADPDATTYSGVNRRVMSPTPDTRWRKRLDNVICGDHLSVPRLVPGEQRLVLAHDREVVRPAEHRSLGVEREVDGLYRYTGGVGDLRHRRPGVAVLAEEGEGGLHDPPLRGARARTSRRDVRRSRA